MSGEHDYVTRGDIHVCRNLLHLIHATTDMGQCVIRKSAMVLEYLFEESEEAKRDINLLQTELNKVKRERDAMFEILSDVRNCADCKYHNVQHEAEPCCTCLENANTKVNWQWRGVEEGCGDAI